MNKILDKFDPKYSELFRSNKIIIKNVILVDWRIKILKDLILMRDFKRYEFLNDYEVKNITEHSFLQ